MAKAVLTFLLILWWCLSLLAGNVTNTLNDSLKTEAGLGKNSSILVPVAFYQEETSVGFGLMGGLYFTKNRINRASNLQGFLIYTLKNQIKLAILPKIYTNDNRFYLSGHVRATHYPDKYFGIGSATVDEQEEDFISRDLSVLAEGQYLINQRFMLGVALGYSRGYAYNLVPNGELAMARPAGTDIYSMPAIGVLSTWDTRDNTLFSSQGDFFKLKVLGSPRALGSSLGALRASVDVRKFVEVYPSHIIASRLFADMVWGQWPFQDLPSLGGNEILRGYYQGRYRDTKMISITSEYRFPLFWRFRGAVFASAGDVQPGIDSFNLKSIKYSFGGGLRFRVNDAKMHIRFDVGITSQGRPAIYFSANESF